MKKVLHLLGVLTVALALASGAYADQLGSFSGVTDADGKPFTAEGLKGKTTMFVVVQAACGQCRAEIEDVKANLELIEEKAELVVVIVDVNSERGIEFFKGRETPGRMVADPSFSLASALGAEASPATAVVNGELKIVAFKTGYQPGDVERLLNKL